MVVRPEDVICGRNEEAIIRIEERIDNKLKSEYRGDPMWFYPQHFRTFDGLDAGISDKELCDELAKKYHDAGWITHSFMSSTGNCIIIGERPAIKEESFKETFKEE